MEPKKAECDPDCSLNKRFSIICLKLEHFDNVVLLFFVLLLHPSSTISTDVFNTCEGYFLYIM